MKHIAVNMKILYLSPGLREPGSVQERIDRWSWVPGLLGEDTTIVGRGLRRGSENSEGDFDDYAGGSEVVKTIMEAVGEGFDAVVIGDTGDPFVPGIREYLNVPVIGPMESSLQIASMLGHKFSIITPATFMKPRKEHQVYLYGYADRLASVRSIDMPVSEVSKHSEKVIDLVVEETNIAVEEDGAQVVIQMCGSMVEYYEKVAKRVEVPIVEPIRAALKTAESLVRLGLSHSKLMYPKPRPKKRML
jgi:allantoin racemase